MRDWKRTRIEWLLLGLVVISGGYFRFHALDWNDAGVPHPDERAVISQTYDMMVEGHFRPRNHTWGHFGYTSTIFAYKGYLHVQHWLNGASLAKEVPISSLSGPAVPHLRELVQSGSQVPLGILAVFLTCLVYGLLRKICSYRLPAVLFLGLAALVALLGYPYLRDVMLAPVRPNSEDVALMGRFIAAFSSTLCIPLVYGIGARLYSRRTGLLAAAFLGYTVLAIQLAHFFAVDSLQAFAILLAIWIVSALYTSRPNPTSIVPSGEPGYWVQGSGLGPIDRFLLRVDHAIPWSTLLLYLALGAAIGMSLASKFSSLPILALPLVVHWLFLLRTTHVRQFMPHLFLLLCYMTALGTWFHLSPFAWEGPYLPFAQASRLPDLAERWLHILFSGEFARQIYEQSRMIEGKGGGPWVQQFAHTTPYLTMTWQMIRWSFGWPLGLVCVGGFVVTVVRNLFRPRAADLLLLSWAAGVFAIVGSFQATFPRYTIAILPLFCLFGARMCFLFGGKSPKISEAAHVWARVGRVTALIAVAAGLLYSTAFMQVYDRMHSWSYASLWIYKNVPPVGQDGTPTVIAHEEWDDAIPLPLPPHSVRYGSLHMTPYQGDSEDKLRRLAADLERADWICLPTTRLYSTILTVPEKYPLTSRYYRLLFAEQLGFTLRKTVTPRAGLWGWEFDDLAADESHRVYDHPKSVIFEKTESLTAEEYYRRITDPSAPASVPTRLQVMRRRESVLEQVLNIERDPYPDEGVVSVDELEALVSQAGLTQEEQITFLAAANQISAIPGLSAQTLSQELTNMSLSVGEEVRHRVSGLPTQPGRPVRQLAALAIRGDLLAGFEKRRKLQQSLVGFLQPTLLPRESVLEKLERIDWDAGPEPRVVTPPPSPESPPGNLVRITQAGNSMGDQIWALLKWLLLLALLGLAVLPLGCRIFRGLPDFGLPLARTLGLIVTVYVVWLSVNLGAVGFNWSTCLGALLITATLCWAPPGLRSSLPHFQERARLRVLLVGEGLFLFTFAAFAIIRAYNPEIFWGEKTMDFSFYNAILRGDTFPPYDPWFSGITLNYYYYGFIFTGFLTKLSAVSSGYGFNLAIASIAAMTVSGAFSLVYNLSKRVSWGLLGAVLVGFVGNFDPLFRLFEGGQMETARVGLSERLTQDYGSLWGGLLYVFELPWTLGNTLLHVPTAATMWDSFWQSSRAIGSAMINEYPVWSWLFADLHAHVLVMPVSLLLLSLIYVVFLNRGTGSIPFWRESGWLALLMLALVLGTQLASNIWDFLCYLPLLGLVFFLGTFQRNRGWISPAAPEHLSSPSLKQDENRLFQDSKAVLGGGWALLLFTALWTLLWPLLCRLHPYWLGLFSDRWIGLSIGLGLVAAGTFRASLLATLESCFSLVWELLRRAVVPMAAVIPASGLLFYHFHRYLETGNTSLKLNQDGNITAGQGIRHFGLFMFLTLLWVACSLGAKKRGPTTEGSLRRKIPTLRNAFALLLLETAAAILLGAGGYLQSAPGFCLYLLLIPPVMVAMRAGKENSTQLFAGTLLLTGWGLAAASEVVVLVDRMNTVFKIYHPVWMLLAVGCAAGLSAVFPGWKGGLLAKNRDGWRLRLLPTLSYSVVAALLLLTLVGTYRGVVGVVTRNLKQSDKPTLNGLDFLSQTAQDSELFEAVDWLNRNVTGPQVIAEAFTNRAYDESARIVKYTGLPTLLGWPHHTRQRGRTSGEIEERRRDLETLYTSEEAEVVARLCRKYRIRYIFVGDFEQDIYQDPAPRLSRMAGLSEIFSSRTGRNRIFQVE